MKPRDHFLGYEYSVLTEISKKNLVCSQNRPARDSATMFGYNKRFTIEYITIKTLAH